MRTQPRLTTRKLSPLSIRFDHALLFAAQVHRNQDRKKSGIPYLSHLLGVAAIVLDYAAEDHGGKLMLQVIEQLFGPRVAKIVDGCTDSYGEEGKRKPKWYPRKLRYLRRVRHEDAETRFVSAADKLYNTRAILRDLRQSGDSAFDRFSAPKVKVLWYYRSLVREYRAGGVTHMLKPLFDDYDRAVTELEHLSGLLAAPVKPTRNGKLKAKKKRSPTTITKPLTEVESITELLKTAKTIAVVGLSDSPFRTSYGVSEYMQSQGYRIIPVNPLVRESLGVKAYASLSDVPERIDIVNVFRRSEHVPEVVEEAIRLRVPAIWMQEGVVHEAAAEKARRAGIFVVMDRCILKEHRRLLR